MTLEDVKEEVLHVLEERINPVVVRVVTSFKKLMIEEILPFFHIRQNRHACGLHWRDQSNNFSIEMRVTCKHCESVKSSASTFTTKEQTSNDTILHKAVLGDNIRPVYADVLSQRRWRFCPDGLHVI